MVELKTCKGAIIGDRVFQRHVTPKSKIVRGSKGIRITMTLVHGEFPTSDNGYAERDGRRNLSIYDWEYELIGHPFCDFQRTHKHVPETVPEEYLRL